MQSRLASSALCKRFMKHITECPSGLPASDEPAPAGIYFNPECTMRPPELLDHAVMISGYGRCPKTGRNYWILKNIWSTYWGEDGYMRMDMDENDCGVTAMAQYVELDAAATDRLNAENA